MRLLLTLLLAVTFHSPAWADDVPQSALMPKVAELPRVAESPKTPQKPRDDGDDQSINTPPADDDDTEARDSCVYCRGKRSLDLNEEEAEAHEAQHRDWHKRNFGNGLVKGFGLTLLGGAVLRAKPDLDKYGDALGPAGDPARISGIFAAQVWMMFTPYLRLGADFTFTNFSAGGRGPDASGNDVRQTANYEEPSGGLLAEGVLPVNKQIEFSLGFVIGAGHLHVATNATRVDDFYSATVDLSAVTKQQTTNFEAEFFDFKPALGLKVKATPHVAVDFRLGMNTVYVPRGSLGYSSDLKLARSPEILELQPFAQVGVSFGGWKL